MDLKARAGGAAWAIAAIVGLGVGAALAGWIAIDDADPTTGGMYGRAFTSKLVSTIVIVGLAVGGGIAALPRASRRVGQWLLVVAGTAVVGLIAVGALFPMA